MTTSLELGCDCLGEIRYLDAVLTDSLGEPSTIPNAICLHEEDNAVLWKHVDSLNGRAEVRRARRMVVSIHATVANYEYLVYWRFYQDGNIECEVRATGHHGHHPAAGGRADAAHRNPGRPAHLRPVPPAFPGRPAGPGHRRPAEHRAWRSTRWRRRSGRRTRTAWRLSPQATPVASEAESARDYNWDTQRAWKVANPNKVNAVGTPVAYKLVPTAALPGDDGSGACRSTCGRR